MNVLATFVGLNVYRDERISPLEYSRHDAEKFRAIVTNGVPPDQLQTWLLVDEQATRRQILTTVGEVLPRAASTGDVVLVYFSGHGSPETHRGIDDTSRYLVTYDTEYDNIFATAIDLEREIVRVIERIPSKLVLVIIDACFSGRAGGRTFEGPRLAALRAGHREAIKLSRIELGEGRVILSACDDDQVAYEDSALQHGVFTRYLLDALTSSHGDATSISVTDLYDEVLGKVRAYSSGRQTPVMNGRLVGARIPIFPRIA